MQTEYPGSDDITEAIQTQNYQPAPRAKDGEMSVERMINELRKLPKDFTVWVGYEFNSSMIAQVLVHDGRVLIKSH